MALFFLGDLQIAEFALRLRGLGLPRVSRLAARRGASGLMLRPENIGVGGYLRRGKWIKSYRRKGLVAQEQSRRARTGSARTQDLDVTEALSQTPVLPRRSMSATEALSQTPVLSRRQSPLSGRTSELIIGGGRTSELMRKLRASPPAQTQGVARVKVKRPPPAQLSRGRYVSAKELGQWRRVEGVEEDFEDGINTTFLVKNQLGQGAYFKISGSGQPISEMLASEIGQAAGVPVNVTKLVPRNLSSDFKEAGEIATMHQIVPGKSLWKLTRNQYSTKIGPTWKGGNLVRSGRENSQSAIGRGILQHPDIARIAALDVFTANRDRHLGNIFLDPTTNRMAGIDMGLGFTQDVSSEFHKAMEGLKKTGELSGLSRAKSQNLDIFYDQLQVLKDKFPLSVVKEKFTVYAVAANANKVDQKALQKYLRAYARAGDDLGMRDEVERLLQTRNPELLELVRYVNRSHRSMESNYLGVEQILSQRGKGT